MLSYFFIPVISIHYGSSLGFRYHSMLVYLKEKMVCLFTGFTKDADKLLFPKIMLADEFISVN